jgi:exodeoxyribonuclease VII large subunit
MPVSPPEHIGLHDLLATLGGLVESSFPMPLWVNCEVVSALAKPKGYWVLQVQDSERGRQAQAQIMVWRSALPRVVTHFERTTGQRLAAGMQILLQVSVRFSPEWGLSLTAERIEPAFTVGQAQLEADRIRAAVMAKGLWEANRRLPAPLTFARVALIAPGGSAGLGDVQADTRRLEAAGVCRFDTHLAAFEGVNAVREVTQVLRSFTDPTAYDAVCLIRGGGGTSGLLTLNHQDVVEAICRCPIPVLVGMGHERDRSLLDEVAHLSLGTPSKVVGHLTHTVIQQVRQIEDSLTQLTQLAKQRLEDAEHRAGALWEETHRVALAGVHQAEQTVTQTWHDLRHRSWQWVERAEVHTENLMRETLGLGPAHTLERGYAWVQGPDGPITCAKAARTAPTLTLHFADGAVGAHPETDDEHP